MGLPVTSLLIPGQSSTRQHGLGQFPSTNDKSILATRLLRAAGQDWYEQGDCWTQLATHRTPALGVVEPSPSTAAAVQRLITATTDTAGSPLRTAPTWVDAFEHAGRRLADLAAHATPHARTAWRARPVGFQKSACTSDLV
ncbi:MAG: hypothetical protein ACRDRA_13555 [Pseudonocardiaceae bacterium]